MNGDAYTFNVGLYLMHIRVTAVLAILSDGGSAEQEWQCP